MKFNGTSLFIFFTLTIFACQSNTQHKTELKTFKDSLGYTVGVDIGKSLKQQAVNVDVQHIMQGIKDVFDSATTAIPEEQMKSVLETFRKTKMEEQARQLKIDGEKAKGEGEKFLAENAKKEGVVTLPSGLQYKVVTGGTGKKPLATQTVTVHYRGTFINGKEFDDSYKRGEPATFAVNQVIPGWTEALQLMSVGSKWQLFIPPSLAYGEQGAGHSIPPNSALIFDVELLEIQ
ncbi:MAG: FKBP-type peptidyl-prolyl cis-trans isomerase [Ignavibacteriales bacterium]|nr:FKBP-type peptidyl-prolyl cis-trans isomerase [Ignavibacteriales bacterium]